MPNTECYAFSKPLPELYYVNWLIKKKKKEPQILMHLSEYKFTKILSLKFN